MDRGTPNILGFAWRNIIHSLTCSLTIVNIGKVFSNWTLYQKEIKKAMFSLAEELFLLSVHEKKHSLSFSSNYEVDYALAGALFAELLLLEKISITEDSRLEINAEALTDDPLLEIVLKKIKKEKKPRKINYWIHLFGQDQKKMKDQIIENLIQKNVIAAKKKKFLWIPYKEYSQQDTTAKFFSKEMLRLVVFAKEKSGDHAIILLSLVRACDLLDHLFTVDEIAAAKTRVNDLVKNEVLGNSVMATIQEISDAAAIAVLAASSSS
jgi:golgi phosphoprotein 3